MKKETKSTIIVFFFIIVGIIIYIDPIDYKRKTNNTDITKLEESYLQFKELKIQENFYGYERKVTLYHCYKACEKTNLKWSFIKQNEISQDNYEFLFKLKETYGFLDTNLDKYIQDGNFTVVELFSIFNLFKKHYESIKNNKIPKYSIIKEVLDYFETNEKLEFEEKKKILLLKN